MHVNGVAPCISQSVHADAPLTFNPWRLTLSTNSEATQALLESQVSNVACNKMMIIEGVNIGQDKQPLMTDGMLL